MLTIPHIFAKKTFSRATKILDFLGLYAVKVTLRINLKLSANSLRPSGSVRSILIVLERMLDYSNKLLDNR